MTSPVLNSICDSLYFTLCPLIKRICSFFSSILSGNPNNGEYVFGPGSFF